MITRWIDIDTIEYVIACSYADGKGFVFSLFFGWREANKYKARFVLGKKDWRAINTMIEYYYKYVKKA